MCWLPKHSLDFGQCTMTLVREPRVRFPGGTSVKYLPWVPKCALFSNKCTLRCALMVYKAQFGND